MIVSSCFAGDEDSATKSMQHEGYSEALWIMVSICREHARDAAALLAVQVPQGWINTNHIDHRTLQDAHNLLAAAWRSRATTIQPELELQRPSTGSVTARVGWLDWLRNEVGGWHSRPRLVRLLLIIVANQNGPEGYTAEAALTAELRDRFFDVPWNDLEARTA